MRSPSIIHQPFPISHITPSTIVLGSSCSSTTSTYSDSERNSHHGLSTDCSPAARQSPDEPEHRQLEMSCTPPKGSIAASLEAIANTTPKHPHIHYRSDSNTYQYYNEEEDSTDDDAKAMGPPSSSIAISSFMSTVTTDEPPERCTSPRRDNSAIERIGREKVHVMRKEAQLMQDSLTDILDRIVKVKEDYDRLSSENRFLQDYIGNLMSSSNILNRPN
ncbi:hypothetical protein TRVA0_007S02696 [Trichomonascus vanleenenianus]|uniref:Slo1p n=1 Tax=Trichomonascus vanleenenianus TaxID=2268995 RepID=UPI003ECB2288